MTPKTLLVGVLALWPLGAHAISCQIVGLSGMHFGTYNVLHSRAVDSAGTITVHCTGVQESDNILIDLGRGGAASYWPRELSAVDSLSYNLYLNAGRTVVWGDGTAGTAQYGPTNPPDGSNVEVPVYGRIPAGQDIRAGVYSDTVLVTVNY